MKTPTHPERIRAMRHLLTTMLPVLQNHLRSWPNLEKQSRRVLNAELKLPEPR